MKLSVTCLLLTAVVAEERGSSDCNGAKLEKEGVDGGPMWKCKSKKSKKTCQGKCPAGTEMTGPKKVMCDQGMDGLGEPHAWSQNFTGKGAENGAPGGWTTKLRSYAHWAVADASCCTPAFTANCNFHIGNGNKGPRTVMGVLDLVHYSNCGDGMDRLVIKGKLTGKADYGFTANHAHGFHIHHNLTDVGASCGDLGGHMDTAGTGMHGGPKSDPAERHMGDLGNIFVSQKGTAEVWINDMMGLSLNETDTHFVGGRGIVIHELVDQFDQQPTGAAASRVGCCWIENVKDANAFFNMDARGL